MIRSAPLTLLIARELPAVVRRPDRDRHLHRVRPGAYAQRAEWASLAPWDRYLARVHAAALTRPAAVFCLESAAALQGMPVFGEPRDIHMLSADGTTRREGDVLIHGAQDGRAVVTLDGISMTARVDTALDLCRVLPPAFALAVADATLRMLSPGHAVDFSARGRAQRNRRGVRQLDWVQARATSVAESVGESVSRAVIEWLGFEEPELQREFTYEGVRDRSDFYWRRHRTLGESDGYGKYEAQSLEAAKSHFVAEKRREDRLRRHEGGFIRWDWSDSLRWTSLESKLRAGGLSPVRLPQRSMLATLASDPRSVPGDARTRAFRSNHGATDGGSA